MRVVNWKCDGCGKSLDYAPDATPDGWTQVEVKIFGMQALDINRTFELCAPCQFQLHIKAQPDKWDDEADPVAATSAYDLHGMPLFKFGLSRRTNNVLQNTLGLKTVADLLKLQRRQLFRAGNFGKVSWNEVKEVILDPLKLEMLP